MVLDELEARFVVRNMDGSLTLSDGPSSVTIAAGLADEAEGAAVAAWFATGLLPADTTVVDET